MVRDDMERRLRMSLRVWRNESGATAWYLRAAWSRQVRLLGKLLYVCSGHNAKDCSKTVWFRSSNVGIGSIFAGV